MSGGGERLGFAPGGVVEGVLRVPGSKSLAQRALCAAALASGTTRIAGLPDGLDVQHATALVEASGARVERLAPAALAITGLPPGPGRGWHPAAPLELGESGTLARFATAALALCGRAGETFELRARGTLLQRRSRALFEALRGSGVELEALSDGPDAADRWPMRVRPLGPPSTLVLRHPASSQEVSALALALAAWPDEIALEVVGIVPSRPYLEMTLAVLGDFGAHIARETSSRGETLRVRGPLRAPEPPWQVEPDASSAAVALAAACLSGGALSVPGLGRGSRQGDVRIAEHLAAFGCPALHDEDGLHAAGLPEAGAELDLAGEPDLAPVLAIVAASAAARRGAASRLCGLGTLRGKESARIEVLAAGLAAVGLRVRHGDDFLEIGPPEGELRGAELASHGDHRIAFAFALLGLVVEGVLVQDPGAASKSWPAFWRDLERAGARLVRV